MPYQVLITKTASGQIRRLPRDVAARAVQSIDSLGTDPRPPRSLKLTAGGGTYRIRVGDYRILYLIDDEVRSATILSCVHRGDAYR